MLSHRRPGKPLLLLVKDETLVIRRAFVGAPGTAPQEQPPYPRLIPQASSEGQHGALSLLMPHRSRRQIRCSLVYTRRHRSGIRSRLPRAALLRKLPLPEAHDPARRSVFQKSHTLHFSASFLIARSTVSPTVDVAIPKTSPI